MRRLVFGTVAIALLELVGASTKAADPGVTCESRKLKASGKYANCLLSTDAKAVIRNAIPDYTRCEEKIGTNWAIAETIGAGECSGGTGDKGGIQDFLSACKQSVSDALASGAPPSPVGDVHTFADNGDGTITDNVTGLMWEKLSDDNSIHDKDDVYTWADATGAKVAALNDASFAGHNDWRVPSRVELETLITLDTHLPATYSDFDTHCLPGCTVTACSCTYFGHYWSSTSLSGIPSYAWTVDFLGGYVGHWEKPELLSVRAVRNGS